MGTSNLHGLLKSLCLNSDWKYAVFWKLKHRARMMLTWEDGYYNSCDQQDALEDKSLNKTLEHLPGRYYSHDPLGLAVAKMSYHVYSLGEGIVGQVAVTGKHQWIIADQHVTSPCPSFEISDGWQNQLSAGIRTIVVVAVAPHGVVQLGSLNKVNEDTKLLTHIRDTFSAVKDTSMGHLSIPTSCSMANSLSPPDLLTKSVALETTPNCFDNSDKVLNKEGDDFSYTVKHSDSFSVHPLSGAHLKTIVDMVNKHGGNHSFGSSSDEYSKLPQRRSNVLNLQHQNQVGINLIGGMVSGGATNGWNELDLVSEKNATQPTPFSTNNVIDSINLCNVKHQAENFLLDRACSSSSMFDSALCEKVKSEDIDSQETLYIPQSSNSNFLKDLDESRNDLSHLDTSSTILNFFPGSELHEALGPTFLKKSIYNNKIDDTEACDIIQMPEAISNSLLTFDSGSENLLEAVVANACHSVNNIKSERSMCKSVQSHLTSEITPEPSIQTEYTINSVGYSIDQFSLVEEDSQQCLNSSELCGAMSSKGISSTCPSTCSEKLSKSSEPAKSSKKRAKPGESCRPRPRDRQLIQDRIKELRELVPNGSKCSIDSLLERTIKHMLFLQSITKHADKLSKCAESKMHQKSTRIQGSSNCDQGSSWAVEVGSHLKVCSIIVENMNKNGQMLVEMMCEECSHFLEIAEAIRTLGLTILKGVTEAHGEKTWICFVVEGQDNRIMHRMDVLWSLVQILQPKTTCS